MTRPIVFGLVAAFAAAASCGGNEREDVLDVMERGRTALLDGDGRAACGLLTDHGRRRVLEFQVDFAEPGTQVPTDQHGVPQTCEEIVQAESQASRESWAPDVEQARFRVASIDGDRATAVFEVPEEFGPRVEFALVKTADGWRIDDSDALPSGY
jgi:hypothetical protein